MNINLGFIKQFDPCESGVNEYLQAGYENFNGTILEFLQLDKISIENKLWVVLREEIIPENDLYELAFKFAESVLYIYEQKYPNDKRPRLAIETKRKWIKGEISSDELGAAIDAAIDAARAAAMDAAWFAARAAAWFAARLAASDAARDAVWAAWAARDAARAAARDAARTAAWVAEIKKQLSIVIEYFKNV